MNEPIHLNFFDIVSLVKYRRFNFHFPINIQRTSYTERTFIVEIIHETEPDHIIMVALKCN